MTTYTAYEDISFGTEIESDDTPEQAFERADERMSKAWEVIEEALKSHPEIGVYVGGRYEGDLSVYVEGDRVAGAR